MDRKRFLDWAEHQLRFFVGEAVQVSILGHRRSAALDPMRDLFFEAHPDGTVVVGIETKDAALRERWAEIFRRTRQGSPPWPPGPPPEPVGHIELHTDAAGLRASLHFRWTFLGQNFLLEVPTAWAGLSWLLLTEPDQSTDSREIELPEPTGEPLELEWDTHA